MISFQNVTRKFENTVALSNVNLEIGENQIVGLLGLNGAGKTTMMRLLTGTLAPTEGSISVGHGRNSPESLQAKQLIGYLPEHCPLYDDMQVQDYLEYIAGLRGMDSKNSLHAIQNLTDKLGLQDRMTDYIHTLSKGYRQRVGLAQALVHQPKIAVLDEPTSGLDPRQIDEIRGLIREIATQTTVILSTHNLHEVETLCDRVIILVQGTIGASGTLEELCGAGQRLSDVFRDAHDLQAGHS